MLQVRDAAAAGYSRAGGAGGAVGACCLTRAYCDNDSASSGHTHVWWLCWAAADAESV